MRAQLVDAMQEVRRRTLDLVSHLPAAALERQVDPIMSPLVWDLAHIAAYEDLWLVHRFAGAPLLRPELAAMYDAFETPRAAAPGGDDEWVTVPTGTFRMGAGDAGFAYDNERSAHDVELPAFRIGR